MIENLIAILSLNSAEVMCEGSLNIQCSDVACSKCPFHNQESLDKTVDELKKAQEKQDA